MFVLARYVRTEVPGQSKTVYWNGQDWIHDQGKGKSFDTWQAATAYKRYNPTLCQAIVTGMGTTHAVIINNENGEADWHCYQSEETAKYSFDMMKGLAWPMILVSVKKSQHNQLLIGSILDVYKG